MEQVESHIGQMGVDSRKLGVWLFLASEIMFFTGLIGAYIVLRFAHLQEWPHPGAVLNIPLTGFNTFLLICSSATLVLGLAAGQRGYREGLQVGLFLTILLGSLFLLIQMKEYSILIHEGLTISSSMYGSCFFTLTGFHGAHVLVGVIWLIVVFIRSMQGKYTPEDSMGVECVGLYWHFVDLVWIILFTIVYLI
ncbi:MAG: cytochrome oxidase subunit III [Candidatus Omnitrophica bacterium CG11_big_fil_rev_8_21_14_0_20_45_26]|uniref:Cytochrome bo(3) ubiquinol oxidase subunit 3 n=1 Tax=Candidatus Abzuiibacterium crystallinum TaxID=1974748 RepID=A0A2H0LU58_9BACT|nr:MAG: cytochrome oxidase subunit III [Candidatus Omnitrophica bacterium CG11_big_fil_rev_8_21_14_0_20_45_26]PIW65708.1 MAG: cytochrome oxidase subunit III [Candidatus Omnitrophica bacterium CG12_big_fil_rev_8_21_14_0_65_45_16]